MSQISVPSTIWIQVADLQAGNYLPDGRAIEAFLQRGRVTTIAWTEDGELHRWPSDGTVEVLTSGVADF